MIITNLYPEDAEIPSLTEKSATRVSWAIHYLAQGLDQYGITITKVLRPQYEVNWRALQFSKQKFRTEIIEGIKVETRSFFNVAKLGVIVRKSDREYIRSSIEGIDLIVSHMPDDTKLAAEIHKKFGVPFIAVLHEYDILNLERQKKLLPFAKNVYARSWSIKRRAEAQGIPIDGIVYSGIEEKWIVGKQSFTKNSKIHFITVAALVKSKNIDIVLRALSQLSHKMTWEYTIVGDGEEFENLQRLIVTLGLEKNVKMLGKKSREECLKEMRNADVFLMPSAPETFGLVYIEAMASGCIVVCAKGAGVDGMIIDGENGYVVEPGSVNALQNTIENLYYKPQDEIVHNSLKTIKEYTITKAQKNYAEIIKKNIV